MTLKKFTVAAGINREGTDYSAEGGWYDCDKIRFRKGRPEKIGGWIKRSDDTIEGACRAMHNWVSLKNDDYLALGTDKKLYVEQSGIFYDITPSKFGYVGTIDGALNAIEYVITVADGTGGSFATPGDIVRIGDEYLMILSQTGNDITVVNGGGTRTCQFNTVGFKTTHLNGAYISRFSPLRPTEEAGLGVIGVTHGHTDILIRSPAHGLTTGTFVNVLEIRSTGVSAGIVTDDVIASEGLEVVAVHGADNYEVRTGATGVTIEDTLWATLVAGGQTVSMGSGASFVAGDIVRLEDEYIKLGTKSGGSAPYTFSSSTRGMFGTTDVLHSARAPNKRIFRTDMFCVKGSTVSNNTYVLPNINAGTRDDSPYSGWGSVSWGSSGWGLASGSVTDFRIWSIDNLGQDLIVSPRNGTPYYWSKDSRTAGSVPIKTGSGGTYTANLVSMAQAVPLDQTGSSDHIGYGSVPSTVLGTMVFPSSKTIVAFGSTGIATPFDPMLIRWSDAMRPGSWGVLTENSAGGNRLTSGSYIVGAERSKREILVWTDESVYVMKFSVDFGFTFQEIASGVSVAGPNASAPAGNSVFWMGDRNFYVYGGNVEVLPCTVLSHVFSDGVTGLNYSQKNKVFASRNTEFGEVIFFYPSGESSENDRYVSYNYIEGSWAVGNMARTAWSDSGIREKPQAAYVSDSVNEKTTLYEHESGTDDDGSAMTAYVESGYFDIEDGDRFAFIRRVIPDVLFTSGNDMSVSIYKKDFPNDGRDSSPVTASISTSVDQAHVRVRGRQAAVRFESSSLNTGWRLGDTRLDIRPDGRR